MNVVLTLLSSAGGLSAKGLSVGAAAPSPNGYKESKDRTTSSNKYTKRHCSVNLIVG